VPGDAVTEMRVATGPEPPPQAWSRSDPQTKLTINHCFFIIATSHLRRRY
jgi:hypothetical protein